MKAFLHSFFFLFIISLCSFLTLNNLQALDSYTVRVEGDIDPDLMQLLESASQLILLRESPPATPTGLRARAEADIDNFLKALHSQAYFNAKVTLDYNFEQSPPTVFVIVDSGPVYPLAAFEILKAPDCSGSQFPYETIELCELGIEIGSPALPKNILVAEESLIHLLEAWGYPLATIKKREVLADQTEQDVLVALYVDSGPLAYFGPTQIYGKGCVRQSFFEKKIAWSAGQAYDPYFVERTQMALEASGLFSSIAIRHAEETDCEGILPMEIEVVEGKHRSVGWGVTYNTERGPGVTAEWENRNKYGSGEKLSADIDLWREAQTAHLAYIIPDYQCVGQDWLWLAEFQHEKTRGYTDIFFSLSSIIERQLNPNLRISYGSTYKWLHDLRSDTNGIYNLFKIPLAMRWSNANSVLDPTRGRTINLKITPTAELLGRQFGYCTATLVTSSYYPLSHSEQWVLATKLMLGSIFGSGRRTIPASERFYEGSENTLRGYHYQTVSPLNAHNKPIGGRSMFIYTAEMRVRATETLGWVLFSDIGNVYAATFPQLDHKLLKSVGFGLRYHTPVGPLRFDFAVPLDRRRHLDPRFQVYISIGQAF
ncbi:MAG: BamA/TamA family outer membrane protein [Parachlamydiaceae bacterium]|nr:BamA/TamA family outer membrane protein [Parachlamydiaceae bacterium]